MKGALACAMACLLLSGCRAAPFARELEDTMLVQVLGIDEENGSVILTAACDPRTGSDGAQDSVLSAQGENMAQAQAALRAAGEEYVALTHVTQLVLGESTDVQAVLGNALNDRVLGQNATVWLVEHGTAKELLEEADGGAKRLSSIELNSGVKPITVLQAFREMEETGVIEIPLLTSEGETFSLAGSETVRMEG